MPEALCIAEKNVCKPRNRTNLAKGDERQNALVIQGVSQSMKIVYKLTTNLT